MVKLHDIQNAVAFGLPLNICELDAQTLTVCSTEEEALCSCHVSVLLTPVR